MKLRWIPFLALVLMLSVPQHYAAGAPLANDITCSASPYTSIYQDEETTDVTVNLSNYVSGNLYGYQLILGFAAANLQAQTPGASFGSLITCGVNGCYDAWNAVIDNGAGSVKFARSQQNPGVPAAADGSMAVVRFKATADAAVGLTTLNLSDLRLADRDGNELPVGTSSCTNITIKGKGFVQGTVNLQGRPDPAPSVSDDSGVTLTIDTNAVTPGVQSPDLYPTAGIASAANGAWAAQKAAAGTYAAATIKASMPRYLDLTCTKDLVIGPNGAVTTLAAVTLPGGDANDDNRIDISDAAIIGDQFGKSPLTNVNADINNDGVVDIFDLVLMGGNYTVGDVDNGGLPLPAWGC